MIRSSPATGNGNWRIGASVAAALFGLAGLCRFAVGSVGEAGGVTLLQPLAARPAALGEACSAEEGAAEVLGFNPAGLGGLERGELGAMYHDGFAGDSYFSTLAGLRVGKWGVAAAISYYSVGSVEWLDPTGRIAEVTAQRDLLGHVGTGYRIPGSGVAVGVSGKVLHTELLEAISDTRAAADAGVRWDAPVTGLSLGASVQNLGGKIRLADDRDDLPLLFRFGAKYRMKVRIVGIEFGTMRSFSSPGLTPLPPAHDLVWLAEYRARSGDGSKGFGAGVEYTYGGLLSLRGGFRSVTRGVAARHDAYTGGVGLALGAFKFDYALEALSFVQLHRVSVTFVSRRR